MEFSELQQMGAGGGLAFALLIGVAPIAFVAHTYSRRFFVVSITTSLAFTTLLAVAWLIFDVLDFSSGNRKWQSVGVIPLGFFLSLLTSVLAGLPPLVFRIIKHLAKRPPPSDANAAE